MTDIAIKPNPVSAWKTERKRRPKEYAVLKPGDLIVPESIIEYIEPNFIGFALAKQVPITQKRLKNIADEDVSSKASSTFLVDPELRRPTLLLNASTSPCNSIYIGVLISQNLFTS